MTPTSRARAQVAWLLWCANEGYLLKEDRDVLTSQGEQPTANWFLHPIDSLHADDRRDRDGWLQLADAVIAAIKETETENQAERLLAAIAYTTIEDEEMHDDMTSLVTFNGKIYMATDDYGYLYNLTERFYPSGPKKCLPEPPEPLAPAT